MLHFLHLLSVYLSSILYHLDYFPILLRIALPLLLEKPLRINMARSSFRGFFNYFLTPSEQKAFVYLFIYIFSFVSETIYVTGLTVCSVQPSSQLGFVNKVGSHEIPCLCGTYYFTCNPQWGTRLCNLKWHLHMCTFASIYASERVCASVCVWIGSTHSSV